MTVWVTFYEGVTFAFAGTLGLNRSMAMEKDRGCLDGLLLTPVDRSAIYFGKAVGNLIFMLLVEVIVEIPSSLTREQEEALRAFAAAGESPTAPGKRRRRGG